MTQQSCAEVEVRVRPIERSTGAYFPGVRALSAGAVGGICSVSVGHPFDLVKVRLQTADKSLRLSAIESVTKSVAHDGLRRVGQYRILGV